jgi:hypothetical protein
MRAGLFYVASTWRSTAFPGRILGLGQSSRLVDLRARVPLEELCRSFHLPTVPLRQPTLWFAFWIEKRCC